MSKLFAIVVCVAASTTIAAVERQDSRPAPIAIFQAFLWGFPLPPGALDQLTPEARTAIANALPLRYSYELLPVSPELGPEARRVASKRSHLEAFIVAVAGDVRVSAEARAYASNAAMALEWEGFSSGPMGEAEFAEAFLNRNPTSAMAPALQLFMLHRFRCAFEAATWEKLDDVQAKAAASYRRAWALLQKSTNTVARAVSEGIDSTPYAYMDVGQHPRTFKPR